MNTYECEIRATKAALEQDPDLSAFWKDSTACRVYGRTGTEYTVRLVGDPTLSNGYTCDCPAGEHGRLCWHVKAAQMRRSTCRPTPKPSIATCPECGHPLDPRTGICLSGRLFGDCDYRPEARS